MAVLLQGDESGRSSGGKQDSCSAVVEESSPCGAGQEMSGGCSAPLVNFGAADYTAELLESARASCSNLVFADRWEPLGALVHSTSIVYVGGGGMGGVCLCLLCATSSLSYYQCRPITCLPHSSSCRQLDATMRSYSLDDASWMMSRTASHPLSHHTPGATNIELLDTEACEDDVAEGVGCITHQLQPPMMRGSVPATLKPAARVTAFHTGQPPVVIHTRSTLDLHSPRLSESTTAAAVPVSRCRVLPPAAPAPASPPAAVAPATVCGRSLRPARSVPNFAQLHNGTGLYADEDAPSPRSRSARSASNKDIRLKARVAAVGAHTAARTAPPPPPVVIKIVPQPASVPAPAPVRGGEDPTAPVPIMRFAAKRRSSEVAQGGMVPLPALHVTSTTHMVHQQGGMPPTLPARSGAADPLQQQVQQLSPRFGGPAMHGPMDPAALCSVGGQVGEFAAPPPQSHMMGNNSLLGKKRPAGTYVSVCARPVPNPNGLACTHCGATRTPVWRAGPQGPKTLCEYCLVV